MEKEVTRMEILLDVRNVSKTFRKKKDEFTAVNQISLTIRKNECVGLIGESGSGKTTIANMIAGFLEVDGGDILFQGNSLVHASAKEKRNLHKDMQMVFQNPQSSFGPRMRLGEGIMEGLNYYTDLSRTEKEKRVDEAMNQTGLPLSYKRKYCFEVSGGECQRAALARAILIRPKLLLCDEITSALDVSVQKQILDLLSELKEQIGMAMLFISHDIALVKDFCDYVYVMKSGIVAEEGEPKQIFTSPKNEYTKLLLDSILTI